MKLELGSGQRPTPGYLHNDVQPFDGIDIVCSPDRITLPDKSLTEVLALGVIEHLTYQQVTETLANCYRMLEPNGLLLFDVPDLPVWCSYLVDAVNGNPTPFSTEHILSTLYGWCRWDSDGHRSGWFKQNLTDALNGAGFTDLEFGVHVMLERGHIRNRMQRPKDAHIYVQATR